MRWFFPVTVFFLLAACGDSSTSGDDSSTGDSLDRDSSDSDSSSENSSNRIVTFDVSNLLVTFDSEGLRVAFGARTLGENVDRVTLEVYIDPDTAFGDNAVRIVRQGPLTLGPEQATIVFTGADFAQHATDEFPTGPYYLFVRANGPGDTVPDLERSAEPFQISEEVIAQGTGNNNGPHGRTFRSRCRPQSSPTTRPANLLRSPRPDPKRRQRQNRPTRGLLASLSRSWNR